jgi:uncharacterized protein (DUF2147 family)
MSTNVRAAVTALLLLPMHQAHATELAAMVGRWTWEKFTIEVSQNADSKLSATITAGPKNVGMEILASALMSKGGDWFGQVVDPETRAVYSTRLRQRTPDLWQLDGCTTSKVCLSGEFVRVK